MLSLTIADGTVPNSNSYQVAQCHVAFLKLNVHIFLKPKNVYILPRVSPRLWEPTVRQSAPNRTSGGLILWSSSCSTVSFVMEFVRHGVCNMQSALVAIVNPSVRRLSVCMYVLLTA